MTAIRGATTIDEDTEGEIRSSVSELLEKITDANSLDKEKIVCIFLSQTSDVTAMYPAKAARECGYSRCALYSSLEPSVKGSLPRCIRVMILYDDKIEPKFVYLKDAVVLRKDLSSVLNVAIDGPAGAGKSTVAKKLAKRLNISYLDTGAMYRAFALGCMVLNLNPSKAKDMQKAVSSIDIDVALDGGEQRTFMNGEDVSKRIRDRDVALFASLVSASPIVREKMVSLQKKIASENSCVMEGRDIGTKVLPDTPFKFYLTASPEVRAKRRFDEDSKKGSGQSLDEIKRDIEKRDERDKSRDASPLKMAEGACLIDSSAMSADEVAKEMERIIQKGV